MNSGDRAQRLLKKKVSFGGLQSVGALRWASSLGESSMFSTAHFFEGIALSGIAYLSLSYLLSTLSGWKELASKYPDANSTSATYRRWQTGQIGWANFANALDIGLTESGIHIKSSIPILFFAPFFIPWSDVESFVENQSFFYKSAKLKVSTLNITISLPEAILREKNSLSRQF